MISQSHTNLAPPTLVLGLEHKLSTVVNGYGDGGSVLLVRLQVLYPPDDLLPSHHAAEHHMLPAGRGKHFYIIM